MKNMTVFEKKITVRQLNYNQTFLCIELKSYFPYSEAV